MSVRSLPALLLSVVVAVGVPMSGTAQVTAGGRAAAPAGPLSPPAACTKAANDWRISQNPVVAPLLDAYRKANDSNRAELRAKYSEAVSAIAEKGFKMAADCAAQFDLETIPSSQLNDLITLYNAARDTMSARRATERFIAATDLSPRQHGQALLLAMGQESTRDPSYFGIIAGAEKYVAQIDQLADSLMDIKLQAHRSMLGRYEYLDVAEGLRSHATAVITLGRKLQKHQDMITGYASLARSYADRLQSDSALRILDAGEKELGDSATARFKDFRNRYALIGTKAPTVTAEWWINPDSKGVTVPAPGRVTLIEFTAHWCGPCKNSYPGLRALSDRLKGKPFGGLMVTQLYGYLGTRQGLTPEQEVDADREYFGKEHALPFPVAINPQMKQVAGQPFAQPQPDMDYRVGGIPQIMIIDKKGIIRQIVTGWDQGNTERFAKLIDQLIAEKM